MSERNELKKLIAEKNTTQEAVAAALGINRSTLYRRLREGVEKLTVEEAGKICSFLRLSDAEAARLFRRR